MEEMPDRVSFKANPDIAAKHILEQYGVQTHGLGGGQMVLIPLKIRRRWFFGYSYTCTYHQIMSLHKGASNGISHSGLTLRVYGHQNIQDAIELAGLLAINYNDHVEVFLQDENPIEITRAVILEDFEQARLWLESTQWRK